jgi:hypothetical protein
MSYSVRDRNSVAVSDRGSDASRCEKIDKAVMHLPARIDTGQGSRLLHCVIDDLWEFGARFTLAIDVKLPGEFVLVLSAEGDARRRCRTLWRDELELSVEFLRDPRESSPTAT